MNIKKLLKNISEAFLICILYPLFVISVISVIEIITGISFIWIALPTIWAIFVVMLLRNNTIK